MINIMGKRIKKVSFYSCFIFLCGAGEMKTDDTYTLPYTWAEIMEKIPKSMPQKLSVYENIFGRKSIISYKNDSFFEYTISNLKTKDGYFIKEFSGRGSADSIEISVVTVKDDINNCISIKKTLNIIGIDMNNKNLFPPNGPEPNNVFGYEKKISWGLMAVSAYNKSEKCVRSFVIRTGD